MFINKKDLDDIKKEAKKNAKKKKVITTEDDDFLENFYQDVQDEPETVLQENKEEQILTQNYPKEENLDEEGTYDDPMKSKKNFVIIYCVIVGIALIGALIGVKKIEKNDYSIQTNIKNFGLVKGEGYQLTLLTNDKKGAKFKVNKEGIVNINQTTGYIEALEEGIVKLEVINSQNDILEVVTIQVVKQKINLTSFDCPSLITLSEGEKAIISLTILPTNATELNFTYKSNNTKVLSVQNNGIIEGIGKGTTTLTVTNGKITKTIDIIVN